MRKLFRTLFLVGCTALSVGKVDGGEPFPIHAGAATETRPHVAFGGGEYFVTWRKDLGDLFATRVSVAGAVLNSDGILISKNTSTFGDKEHHLAFGNGIFLVVAERNNGSQHIIATRVTLDGTVLDPIGIGISPLGTFTPKVATDGTNFLAVWGGGPVSAARVTSNGVVLDPNGIVLSPFGASNVAFDGTNYLVILPSTGITQAVRVSPSGQVT